MPLQATSGAASYDGFGGGVAAVPNYIEDVFSTYLYTGNGSTQTITNGIDLSGKGGLVWTKARSLGNPNVLVDTARGARYGLFSNTTDANVDYGSPSTGVVSFGSTGYPIGSDGSFNGSGATYASWTFRKQPKFFDVVTYTGNGTTQAISHNLGSKPGFIVVKQLNSTNSWVSYHQSLGASYRILLNLTNAALNTSPELFWGNTSIAVEPTSTAFTIGSNAAINGSGSTYVAYLFAHNAGGFGLTGTDNVISCGIVNGASAPTVNLGYEPQFVMFKAANTTGNWLVYDNMRGWTANNGSGAGNVQQLLPNTSGAETATTSFYTTSTGFAFGGSTVGFDYIYIAIRRGPMKVPTSGTSVFVPVVSASAVGTATTTNFPVDLQIFTATGVTDNKSVVDRLRGVNTSTTLSSLPRLNTVNTDAEASSTLYSNNWGSTGFGIPGANASVSSVYWNFRRAPSFFDEVCYTGTGTSTTTQVSHNLTVIPELIILKERNGATNWKVMCALNGSSSPNLRYGMELNTTITGYLDTAGAYQTYTTSAYFNPWLVGAGVPSANTSGKTYVAYLFATCAGVSKVGSYTGTGTTQQINCGFTAGSRFVLIKRTDSTGDWYVWDSARGIVAGNDPYLLLNSTAAEVTSTDYVDTYSAGFEISSTAPAAINASGGTFIFLAIA